MTDKKEGTHGHPGTLKQFRLSGQISTMRLSPAKRTWREPANSSQRSKADEYLMDGSASGRFTNYKKRIRRRIPDLPAAARTVLRRSASIADDLSALKNRPRKARAPSGRTGSSWFIASL
jgi:hypothetical protein